MKIPTYTFLQRDAALRTEPKKFCDTLISTKRFWRDEHGFIQFEVAKRDVIRVANKLHLEQILQDDTLIRLEGDIDNNAFAIFWLWLTAGKHWFPRSNPDRPYSPPVPPGVAHVAPADRYRKAKDCA